MFIPDTGSEFFPCQIPDPNFFHPGSASKNSCMLTQKMVSKLSEIWSVLFIPNPDHDFLPIPDPGSRGRKGTGSRIRDSGSATLVKERRREVTARFAAVVPPPLWSPLSPPVSPSPPPAPSPEWSAGPSPCSEKNSHNETCSRKKYCLTIIRHHDITWSS